MLVVKLTLDGVCMYRCWLCGQKQILHAYLHLIKQTLIETQVCDYFKTLFCTVSRRYGPTTFSDEKPLSVGNAHCQNYLCDKDVKSCSAFLQSSYELCLALWSFYLEIKFSPTKNSTFFITPLFNNVFPSAICIGNRMHLSAIKE